jgi:hypothetical protein
MALLQEVLANLCQNDPLKNIPVARFSRGITEALAKSSNSVD